MVPLAQDFDIDVGKSGITSALVNLESVRFAVRGQGFLSPLRPLRTLWLTLSRGSRKGIVSR